jgi:hypothetical protein
MWEPLTHEGWPLDTSQRSAVFIVKLRRSFFYDTDWMYAIHMSNIEIVQSSFHSNGHAAPFYAAIVDDPDTGETKIVIMFDEPEYTAVLSLDALLNDEDISHDKHNSRGDIYDSKLRDVLWYPESGS